MRELAFDVPSSVVRSRCSFLVGGSTVVGDVYRPKEAPTPVPGVVFGGPLSSVKEQSTGAYGSALAAKGYACLSLDHRGFGESEGLPRQYEDYGRKIQDLEAAVDWLAGADGVDPEKIGTVGVCLGAAYTAWASVANPKVKAAGAVVGLFPEGGPPSREGEDARLLYERTGEVTMIKAASITEDAAMPMQIAVDYYGDPRRALVRNYRNEVALMYRERWQEFNAPAIATTFTLPLVMIHGKQSFAMHSGLSFYHNVQSKVKSLHWIDHLPHTDFYDNPDAIDDIATILDDHFKAAFLL